MNNRKGAENVKIYRDMGYNYMRQGPS